MVDALHRARQDAMRDEALNTVQRSIYQLCLARLDRYTQHIQQFCRCTLGCGTLGHGISGAVQTCEMMLRRHATKDKLCAKHQQPQTASCKLAIFNCSMTPVLRRQGCIADRFFVPHHFHTCIP